MFSFMFPLVHHNFDKPIAIQSSFVYVSTEINNNEQVSSLPCSQFETLKFVKTVEVVKSLGFIMEFSNFYILSLFLCLYGDGNCQSINTDAIIDVKELRCLVCESCIHEVSKAINKLDPNKKVDVGGYRLDIDGNYKHKAVPEAKSELALSELIEKVCDEMDNYVRATWKSNGTLTLLKMTTDEGTMNPNFADVDFIQDSDLNKSLKYYCEEFMGEYEEELIKLYQEDYKDVQTEFCVVQTKLCTAKRKINQEL